MTTLKILVLAAGVLCVVGWAFVSDAFAGARTVVSRTRRGMASWYGEQYRGSPMANGEAFDPDRLTAASWDWPLGAWVRVMCPETGRSVWVRITDRGPERTLWAAGRIIDLSEAAFARIAPTRRGLIEVEVVRDERPEPVVVGQGRKAVRS